MSDSEYIRGELTSIKQRQDSLEGRLESSEKQLATAVNHLTGVISNLAVKLEYMIGMHQRFIFYVLLILAGTFLGKEFIFVIRDYVTFPQ